jgi:hypothetical protein
MTASTILKGMLAGAGALAIAGAVLAQVATGTPSSGTGIGVTPPPSTGATNDTSRLATDCDKVAADMRSNTPPHLAMGCDKSTTVGTTRATTSNTTAMGANGAPASTAAAPAGNVNTTPSAPNRATKLAKADRG